MLKASLRNLGAHKVRLLLSGLAIVLAVAFVAGTYIFTDSLRASLDSLVRQDTPDVTVTPGSADFTSEFRGEGQTATVPMDLVAQFEALPGAQTVLPEIQVPNVVILDNTGKPLGTQRGGFASGTAIGQSWITDDRLNPAEVMDGEAPTGRDQVGLDTGTAEELGVVPGDEVTVLLPSGDRRTFTLSGTTALSGSAGFGVGFVSWDFQTAQRLLLQPGQATSIALLATRGTSQENLLGQVTPLLPAGLSATTGAEQANQISEQLNTGLGFLNTFLLVFAVVSLFVAAFLIYNTFSMLVAQRSRELALLRAIGASRGQVLRSILVEALLVALLSSVIGIGVGAAFAKGLQLLFQAAGAPFPASALVLQPRTIGVALAVGVLITMASAVLPARRAGSVAPIAALREVSATAKALGRRTLLGAFALGVGVGLAVMSPRLAEFSTMRGAMMAGVAAAAVLLGLLALAPELSRPAASAFGVVFRGVTGRLARGNARRNPRRTAATAGALTIGMALMAAISVLAASTQKSVSGIVDQVIGADFIVTGYGFQPFPGTVADTVGQVPGVAQTAVVRQAPMRAPGTGDTLVVGVDPQDIQQALNLEVPAGSISDLGDGKVALDSGTAADIGAGIGTTIQVLSVAGPVDLDVVALYEPAGGFTGYVVDLDQAQRLGAGNQDSVVYVVTTDGVSPETVEANLNAALAEVPNVQVLDQSAFKQSISDQIGQLLTFLYALLLLAVLIALLGIVNTLALSVFERTREIGLLRAVGMSKAQIRRAIVIEAFLIAVFGAVLGLVTGVAFGALLQRILASEGIDQFAVNAAQLAVFVVLSCLGGVVAALWPAWRAARLRILEAIGAE
jgi:putative ABC transport system permease protein